MTPPTNCPIPSLPPIRWWVVAHIGELICSNGTFGIVASHRLLETDWVPGVAIVCGSPPVIGIVASYDIASGHVTLTDGTTLDPYDPGGIMVIDEFRFIR